MQDRWLIVDQLYLYTSDRDVLLNNKEWLNDNHMTCTQKLIKNQFPQYNGLQNTILQQTKFLKPLLKNSLQIFHTGENEITGLLYPQSIVTKRKIQLSTIQNSLAH